MIVCFTYEIQRLFKPEKSVYLFRKSWPEHTFFLPDTCPDLILAADTAKKSETFTLWFCFLI